MMAEMTAGPLAEPLAKGGLIVSCQARPPSPFEGPVFMAAFARAAAEGGAAALRVNGPADIAAVRQQVALPIIGIHKVSRDRNPVYITPSKAAAGAVVAAGADVVAVDATARERPADPLDVLIAHIVDDLDRPVMADIATLDEGLRAADLGCSYVATTLAGHTGAGPPPDTPDLALVEALAGRCSVPVVAEGRLTTPEDVRRAFAAGAHAVVVGTAITNPGAITARFAAACPRHAA